MNEIDASIRERRKHRLSAAQKPSAPKLWLLDLDDTLFEASGGMLHAIHLRMNEFMSERLGLSWDEASRLRRAYWRTYGTTFLGLWRCHGIDPREFLPATHDFDFSPFIRVCGSPREDLAALPGRKVVFTNGPRNYADAVLEGLGLTGFFDDVVTSSDMRIFGDWRPKPNGSMIRHICAKEGVPTRSAVLVDDTPMNLKAAKAAGLSTVWCTGYRRKHGGLANVRPLAYVDQVIEHIRDLKRIARSL